MIGLMLVGAVLADDSKPSYNCDVSVGAGTHYAFAGVAGGCQVVPYLGLRLGVGSDGEAFMLQVHPNPERAPGWFAGLGYAPVVYFNLWDESYAIEGVTFVGGYTRRKGRVNFNSSLGAGVADLGLLGTTTELTFDIGVGVNFGTFGSKSSGSATGASFCPSCGHEFQDGENYCPNDGTAAGG